MHYFFLAILCFDTLWLLIQYMYSKILTDWIMCFMLWIFQVCALLWCKHYKELISSHGFALNQLTIWKYPTMTKVSELSGNLLNNNLHIQCNLWIKTDTIKSCAYKLECPVKIYISSLFQIKNYGICSSYMYHSSTNISFFLNIYMLNLCHWKFCRYLIFKINPYLRISNICRGINFIVKCMISPQY